jgi:hypothetical protein
MGVNNGEEMMLQQPAGDRATDSSAILGIEV